MKVYITKYALTGGIEEGEISKEKWEYDEKYIFVQGWWGGLRKGSVAFDTPADAMKAAEAMRVKKLASLERSIAKLKELRFEQVENAKQEED